VQHNRDFLTWLSEKKAREHLLKSLAHQLSRYLTGILSTPESCRHFWSAIPSVRSACNENKTYAKPFAVEAYAYVHLLDRYWRTWGALVEMTKAAVLPLGQRGVRILDVGTGPAPTPYAISDFYDLLREYGLAVECEELTQQTTHFSIIEKSPEMCRFMHRFGEFTERSGPSCSGRFDFSLVDPPAEREELLRRLLNEEYYDYETGDSYSEYLPEEANWIAQRHARFRLVIFSNFFTLEDSVQAFEQPLRSLLLDLRPGSGVIVIGARGSHYPKIYSDLISIAEDAGLVCLDSVPGVLGRNEYEVAARVIKKAQHQVYVHLESIVGKDQLSQDGYPDYWSPEPHPKKRVDFALRVFRKGNWPRQPG